MLDVLSKKEIHQTRDSMLSQIQSNDSTNVIQLIHVKKFESFIFKNIIFHKNGTRSRMPDF